LKLSPKGVRSALMKTEIKRAYEQPDKDDGARVLVDRIWPRGLTKEKAHVDLWLKEIAPSTELRKWFNHDPDRWAEFKTRYNAELRKNPEQVALLKKKIAEGKVTLVYSAKDEQHNQAKALQQFLER
jgi:uncharacterized protein YeaO (DUF488 family)